MDEGGDDLGVGGRAFDRLVDWIHIGGGGAGAEGCRGGILFFTEPLCIFLAIAFLEGFSAFSDLRFA